MTEQPETKQKLLDISLQLMMSKGYNATKILEICELAEVTKGAFFHYFKTKEMLGVSVLDYYWQTRRRQFADSDWISSDDPITQIRNFVMAVSDVFMADPKGYSCLAGSFSQELATTSSTFQGLVSTIFAEWADQIKPILQTAMESARNGHDIDIDLLADHIIVVIEGALVLALARQDRSVIAQQLDMLCSYLESIFGS